MKSLAPITAIFLVLLTSCTSVAPGDRERVESLRQSIDRSQPFAESAFVVTQGLSVHYRSWRAPGPSVGQVLLIHGFGASTFSFRFVVPALLAAGWDVAAADIPPFGFSDHDTAALQKGADRAELLWAVADQLGWKRPVLLGHSMGGLYATLMAQAHPERTRALVLMAGAVPVDGKTGGGAPFFAGLLTPFLEDSLRSWSSVKNLLEGFALKGEAIPDEMVDGYVRAFQGPNEAQALIAWATAPGAPPVIPQKLTMPVRALWGELDDIVPVDTGKKLVAAVPGASLVVVPGVGHLAHELNAGVYLPHLVGIMSELE